MRRGLAALAAAAALVLVVVPMMGSGAGAAVGGPVILGGDDLTDHGSFDTTNNVNVAGWLYLQKALENIKPQVTRANDGSVAALGSAASTATSGNAGAAIGRAAAAAGLTVVYSNGAAAINQFFTDLRAGTARPAIIWIAGDNATNDLGDSSGAEAQALVDNAITIADFVNSGGGLMSHGTEYGWLSGLLPGASTVSSGASGDLTITPEGQAAFPGLTNADVNAGPWHNHFAGNLGGLAVLVRSTTVTEAGAGAPVVIGGAAVQLPGSITLDPPSATNPQGTPHTVTATVRNNTGALANGVTVTFTVTAGPNSGKTGSAVTNASGQAAFTYTGTGGTGTDTITASFTDTAGAVRSATATKTWTAGATTSSSTTTTSTTVVTTTSTTTRSGICNAGNGGAGGTAAGTGGNATAGAGGTATGGAAAGVGGAGGTGGDACNVRTGATTPPPPPPPPGVTTSLPPGTPPPSPVQTTAPTATTVAGTVPAPVHGLLARTGAELRRSTSLALAVGAFGLLLYAGSHARTRAAAAAVPPAPRPFGRTSGGPARGPLDPAALDALEYFDRT